MDAATLILIAGNLAAVGVHASVSEAPYGSRPDRRFLISAAMLLFGLASVTFLFLTALGTLLAAALALSAVVNISTFFLLTLGASGAEG